MLISAWSSYVCSSDLRPVALGAHPRVDQDLRDRVLRSRAFLALVSRRAVRDVVHRVVVADVLQRVGDALDEIFLLDRNRTADGKSFVWGERGYVRVERGGSRIRKKTKRQITEN